MDELTADLLANMDESKAREEEEASDSDAPSKRRGLRDRVAAFREKASVNIQDRLLEKSALSLDLSFQLIY